MMWLEISVMEEINKKQEEGFRNKGLDLGPVMLKRVTREGPP